MIRKSELVYLQGWMSNNTEAWNEYGAGCDVVLLLRAA
jgi:hypothetical protein